MTGVTGAVLPGSATGSGGGGALSLLLAATWSGGCDSDRPCQTATARTARTRTAASGNAQISQPRDDSIPGNSGSSASRSSASPAALTAARRLAVGDGLAALDQAVHALAGRRRHQGRFAEDQREDLVTGGDLREMDVGLQTGLFEFGDEVAGQLVVEVFGDGVGVELGAGAVGGRRGEAAAARDLLDAGDQFLGGVALRDLLADLLDFVRFQRVVEISQQGPQG